MKYFAVIDAERPDPREPWSIFRTPDAGGPPMELYDPATDSWDEEVSLIAYFTGDDMGAVLIPDEVVDYVVARLRAGDEPDD